MASESWEDQAVVVEPPEIKLFGQWSAQDVQVGDISLTVSIYVCGVFPPRNPTGDQWRAHFGVICKGA